MEALKTFFSDQFIEAFGWAIFHSVWQAIVMLILLLITLLIMRHNSARIRYFVSYAFMVLILVCSVVTGIKAFKHANEKQIIKENLLLNAENMALEIKDLLGENKVTINNSKQGNNLTWLSFKSKIQANFYIVFVVWIIGIILLLVKMAGGLAYLQKLAKVKIQPINEEWNKKIDDFIGTLKIKRKVEIYQSYLAKVPMVVGHLKPIVLIPINLFTGLSNQEIEAIIAHELAHIKRHDYLLNIIQSVIETIFFFHPAVWVISRIIRNEREHSCDDLAVAATGDTLNYIKALASAQEFSLKNDYNAVAFAQSSGGLLTRVKRLKTLNNMKNKVSEGFFAASLIFVSLIFLSFTFASDRTKYESFDPVAESFKFSPTTNDNLSPEKLEIYKDTIKKKVKKRVKKIEKVPKELEKVIEVALTEEDDVVAIKILASVDEALKEIEWEEIKVELIEAKREIENLNLDSIIEAAEKDVDAKEIRVEILKAKEEMEALNIDSIIEEATKELKTDVHVEFKHHPKKIKFIEYADSVDHDEAVIIAKDALHTAKITLETINLDSIVEISVAHSLKAIEDMDIEKIIVDALGGLSIEIKNDSVKVEKLEELEKELDELENLE